MSAKRMAGLGIVAAMAASLLGVAQAAPQASSGTGVVRAGVAVVDLSWNVGRNQGQLGSAGNMVTGNRYDPFLHTTTQVPTEGIQARLSARALVVEGPDGKRVAFLKNDHYLQQDLLHRRVSQIVEAAGVGITRERLMIGATHNHSAPYGATTSWGVWLFADAFDAREFDYFATRMASAVIEAARSLRPVRVGASVGLLSDVQQNILGPTTADDGTPAGFPRDHFDPELAVIRFDDMSDPTAPAPYAALVNFGMHPESLLGNGLLSPDFVGMVEGVVDRATGAVTVWSQGALGDVEPDRTRANPPEARAEYWRRDYSQQERMSRMIAASVIGTWEDVADGQSAVAAKHVPFQTVFPVDMIDISFPGPASHPIPTVSNCRTEQAAGGTIGVPVAGLPDCSRQNVGPDLSAVYDAAKDAGLPVNESYGSVSGYTGAQETVHAHLQVMRLGEILLGSCPCEPVTDMVLNFKTRAAPPSVEPEMYRGWTPTCVPHPDDPNPADPDTYQCERPRHAWQSPILLDVPRDRFERMMAQIQNDAAGWDAEDPESIAWAEAEPADPEEIKGNFTHEHITDLECGGDPCAGYTLPLMVGTANDYIGYIITYREYMRGDHYRKALTPFGPHSADYVNTRLVRMAAALQGAAPVAEELFAETVTVEDAYLDARARAVGEAAAAGRAAYEAALPDDGGTPGIVMEPSDLERFDGAQVRWTGGSTYTDDPRVRVERQVGGGWKTAAVQEGGEVIVTIEYRAAQDPAAHADFATGDLAWVWTATWEVFEETIPGTYRFVIDGRHRAGGSAHDYVLSSAPFEVEVWSGIEVDAVDATEDNGEVEVRFTVADIAFPTTYSPVGVSYISSGTATAEGQVYCFRCTFRPWASSSQVLAAEVIVLRNGGAGGVEIHPAAPDGSEWVVSGLLLDAGDEVWIGAGGIRDEFENVNGTPVQVYPE